MDDSMLDVAEQLSKFIDMAAGYKMQCNQAGFSMEASEQMAVDLHRVLIGKVLEPKK